MSEAGVIRPAVAADAADVARLHAELFDGPWSVDTLARLVEEPGTVALVVQPDRDAAPCAFALARVVADEAEILSIGVGRQAQRRGVGRRLLAATVEAVRAAGAGRLFLEVARANTAARGLYAATGFTEIAVRRGYYLRAGAPPEDALVLALDLASRRTMD